MATLSTPLSRQVYPLDKDFAVGDLTFDIVGRFKKTSAAEVAAGTEYIVGSQVFTHSMGSSASAQEDVYINVTAAPTTVDAARGVYRYTISEAANRGGDSDNSVVPFSKSQTGNQLRHRAGRLVGISINPVYQAQLENAFTASSGEDTAVLGETIAELKAVAIDKSDNLLYKFDDGDANHNLVGILKTGEGGVATDTKTYVTFNGQSTGHTGLTTGAAQYADTTTAGDLTETATSYKLGNADNTGTAINMSSTNPLNKFADNVFDVHDDGDATKDLVFSLAGATTAKTMTITSSQTDDRTITLPDSTGTLGNIVDEDDMASDSAVLVPTQQSTKAYVDNTRFADKISWSTIFETAARFTSAGDGDAAVFDATGLTISTSAVAGKNRRVSMAMANANYSFGTGNVMFSARVTPSAFANDTEQFGIGIFDDAAVNLDKDETTDGFGFVFQRVSGALNIYAINADGTNTQDLVATFTNGTVYDVVAVRNGTTNIKFYVNGTLESTSTTNIPTGDLDVPFLATIKNHASSGADITANIGYYSIEKW